MRSNAAANEAAIRNDDKNQSPEPAAETPAPATKAPDALKAARRVLSILLPFSQRRRQAILQMAAMLCEPETP